jgi:TatD DNase family protein
VVAIGETGLDYYRLPSGSGGTPADDQRYKESQARIFRQQLEVAAELGLNCVIHQRGETLDDTLALMQPWADRVRGVFHCFAGDIAALRRIQGIGSIVSFTGIVTFKNGQNVRDAAAATALGEFMLETDCPYLAPVPYRGKRCEPAHVKEIADVIAQVKGCSLDELSRATCDAAHGFFPKLAP